MNDTGRQMAHREVLANLLRAHGCRTGAEIGVLNGTTSLHLLQTLPLSQLYLVDQWAQLPPRDVEGAETYAHRDMPAAERLTRGRMQRFGQRAVVLKGDSVTMAGQVPDASLDFVFIDGDHTEAGFRADLLAWAPKVRGSGYLCGHDWSWPTVRRVLDELLPGWEALPADVWAIPKTEAHRCA